MKHILFSTFFVFTTSVFATQIDFEVKTQSNKKLKFKVLTDLGKQASVSAEGVEISVTPTQTKVQNMTGIVLDLIVSENKKQILKEVLFLKPGKDALFSKKNFSNAPQGFSLKAKVTN